jgi:DNA-damage-inducible protein D
VRFDIIQRLHKNFEEYVHLQNGVEFWFARDLQALLGYTEWRNFLNVIEKAKESCKKSNHVISDHFVDINKMVAIGSGTKRRVEDSKLTRYACYLIAQNGDPRKDEIAFTSQLATIWKFQIVPREVLEQKLEGSGGDGTGADCGTKGGGMNSWITLTKTN